MSDESATRLFGEFCGAGLWPGVGRVMAEKLQAAGITSPDDVTAGRLELVEGIGPKRAVRLAAAFTRAQPAYETAGLLTSCRVPAKYAGSAVALLGPLAAETLREDPWKLLTLPQIRPDQADWFARQVLDTGATPQDPRRGRALVVHLLNKASRDGHTAAPAEAVLAALGRFGVGDPGGAVVAAIDDGSVLPFETDHSELPLEAHGANDAEEAEVSEEAEGAVEPVEGDGQDSCEVIELGTLLALTQYAIAEDAVAEGLQRLAATAEPLPGTGDPLATVTDAELDDRQHAAVAAVAEHGVSVLTGGPGTGKSRTVAAVVALASQRGLRVALAAPTGRAAKRLEERAGAPATTLHRLLGAQGQGMARPGTDAQGDNLFSDGPGASTPGGAGFPGSEVSGGREGTWVFARGEDWPLDAELVVVDESSMLDVELAAALIEACADGTRLLLVGDPAQLPSIGPGRILADIIDSGAIPVTELTTLYRQKDGGTIAKLATAVRGGELPAVDSPEHEVVVVTARGSAEAAHRVTQLMTDSIPRALGIAAEDIQIVTPVHKGPAGTIELNRALKAKLNPGPGAHRGFDPGDRVVAVANHADNGFANGEVGTVVTAEGDGLTVSFSGLPVTVPFRLLADLRHGWAITVHRAQGSEWPAVVAVFPAEATGMLSRPLVYTALTRAQHHLSVVHGAGSALARAVRTIGEHPRETRLAALLTEAMADLADPAEG
ncbi:MAG TPA: AAA family ATPase [Streptosporangiaceae bacterium]